MPINIINLIIAVMVTQVGDTDAKSVEQPAFFLKKTFVSQEIYSDRIVIEWEPAGNGLYSVMRSKYKTKDFTVIAQTDDARFEDADVEKGVKYWYKIIPPADSDADDEMLISDEVYSSFPENEPVKQAVNKTDPAGKPVEETKENTTHSIKPVSYSGCTSIENPSGVNLNSLIKLKKDKLKIPAGAEEKAKQKNQLEYLKKHYMNSVKLSLFMSMAKPYFDKGDLRIFADCDSYEIKKPQNQVVFIGLNYSYMVTFESKKFIKILNGSAEKDLPEILIKNSELYCVPGGQAFVVDKAGITRLVPVFDAVALSTRYLKNDIEWKSRTIMTATSRPDLKNKLKSASKKEDD